MNKKQRTHMEKRLVEERDRVMQELGHYDESFSSTLQASDGDLSSYSFHMADQGTETVDEEALGLLRRLTGDPSSRFRPDQLDVIRRIVVERERVLLVQRTGWGKSAVYFIATKMLRHRGFGPTLLVSPLLALMRNQIEAAEKMGVRAVTINSSNMVNPRFASELETVSRNGSTPEMARSRS